MTYEQLTERFYVVREQRNRLLWACERALAAYDQANATGKGNWSGKDVDAMRALVQQVKAARFDSSARPPDTTVRCPDCGPVAVASDVFEGGKGISGECPQCECRLYYAPPVFSHCNVCGKPLREPKEDEMGMCEDCANL